MNETCEPSLCDDAERRHQEGGPSYQEPAFYTDDTLCKRWHCSQMALWRRRKAGTLPRPIKIGGTGRNLTPASVVHAVEAAR
jgi:hypothetical protein